MKKTILALLSFLALLTQPASGEAVSTSKVMDETVALQTKGGRTFCSGVVTDGYILTAEHCTGVLLDTLWVEYQGERFPVVLVRANEEQDIALLAPADGRSLGRGLKLSRKDPKPGDKVFAVGYPLGQYGKHISSGIVSAPMVVGHFSDQHVLYHDAGTVGGNSGGPVVNERGRIVGITSYGILQGVVCQLSCPGAFQDTHLSGATHVAVLRGFLDN